MTPEERKALTLHAIGILEINMLDILRSRPGMDRNSLQVAMGLPDVGGWSLTVLIAERLKRSGQVMEHGHPYKYRLVNSTVPQ